MTISRPTRTFLLFCVTTSVIAFTTPQMPLSHRRTLQTTPRRRRSLHMAKNTSGKGFGKQTEPPPPPPSKPTPSTPTATTTPTVPETGGAAALARLRRTEAEKRDSELRSIRDLRAVDTAVASAEQSAVIPERVAQRMGMRMLPFVGLPLFGGMGVFVGFWYFATYKGVEVLPNVVAGCTIAVLVIGLLGITYSVMSASWDPETEGSALGVSEFATNINSIQDGLRRSRENLLLREKMNRIPEDELEGSVGRLERDERRRESKEERGLGLKEKMEKEME